MKLIGSILLSVLVMVFGVCVSAHAALVDMNDGTIYDIDTQLSWLKDANYAKTSGYDADGMMTGTKQLPGQRASMTAADSQD